MIYQSGHLARPLDSALSAQSRIAVLRVLRAAGEAGRGGREVARAAGINHQSAALALQALAELGVVERRAWGRKVLWRLKRRHWLVSELIQPLFDAEARYAEGVAALLKSSLKGRCRALLLTGAAANGRLKAGEPLSVIAVEGGPKKGLGDALRELKGELAERWGVALDARIVSPREAVRIAALDDAWRLLPDEGRGFTGL
jgi:hypothetical protein